MTIKEKISEASKELKKINVESYYVGGCVRDEIMGIPCDDYDVCLVGVTNKEVVEKLLFSHFDSVTSLVGQAFPVWKARFSDYEIDFAMARKETLVGDTRTDFEVITSGVTIEEDLRRRDFTINAIAQNVLTGEYIDPFDGVKDIERNMLTPTSEAFSEDSLRVYRAARFLARFPNLRMSAKLKHVCQDIVPKDISPERVGMEFTKCMEQAVKPSLFFDFLLHIGWLGYHFKELLLCVGLPQDPTYHPEGDVYTHTMLTLDEATDPFTRVCMVCHDLGKVTTTTVMAGVEGRVNIENLGIGQQYRLDGIKSIGHELEGIVPTRKMLSRIFYADTKTIRQIELLVELHMIKVKLSEKTIRKTLRRLFGRKLTFEHLVEVCRCDMSGRPPLEKHTPDIGQSIAAKLISEDAITPIVTGDMLISIGFTPGKEFGHLIDKCLEWQDRGTLTKTNWETMIKQYKVEN